MSQNWMIKAAKAICALILVPVFMFAEFYTQTGTTRLLCFSAGILALISVVVVIAFPNRRAPARVYIWRGIGSLIFGMVMLVSNSELWIDSGFSSRIWLWAPVFLIAASATGWFLQEGIARLLSWMGGSPGDQNLHSIWIFIITGLLTLAGLVSLKILCPGITTAIASGMTDSAILSARLWPSFPGILISLISGIMGIFHASQSTIVSVSIYVQITAFSAAVGYAWMVLYQTCRKFWPIIVGLLLMFIWYPCWIYVYALDGMVWMAMGLLLTGASLGGILGSYPHALSYWICFTLGILLICLQVSWGWIIAALTCILVCLFRIWRSPGSSLSLLGAGVLSAGLFLFALPLVGLKADYSGFYNIPIAQVSRIASLRDIPSQQSVNLSQLASLPDLAEAVNIKTVDPVRALLDENQSWTILQSNTPRYLSLYTDLITSYPVDAVLAFNGISGGFYDGSIPENRLPAYNASPIEQVDSESQEENAAQATLFENIGSSEAAIASILEIWFGTIDRYGAFLVSPGFQFWVLLFIWIYGCGNRRIYSWSSLLVLLYILFESLQVSHFSSLGAAVPMIVCMPLLIMGTAAGRHFNADNALPHLVPDEDYASNDDRDGDDEPSSMKKVSRRKRQKLAGKFDHGVATGR